VNFEGIGLHHAAYIVLLIGTPMAWTGMMVGPRAVLLHTELAPRYGRGDARCVAPSTSGPARA
jgi:hypothetical protein